MNKFEPGDRISFINERLNGVVIKILASGNYLIETEDGFEIDATPAELVKIVVAQKKPSPIIENAKAATPVPAVEITELRKSIPGLSDCVSLVLMPSDASKVLTGSVKYFLVNESKYDVLFSFSNKQNKKLSGISSGKVEASNEIYLGEFTRDVLMDSECLQIQLLFHQKNFFLQIPVLTKELPIEYPDLNHVNKNLNGAIAFSKLITLISFGETAEEDLTELVRKFQHDKLGESKPETTQSFSAKPKEQYSNYNISPGFIEIDLHIEELVDDTSGLSNAEIIQIQLQHFRKAIDNALLRKAHKITFIHGVGNGRLKHAIREEINTIPNLSCKDAPYEKYGAGATEVLLK